MAQLAFLCVLSLFAGRTFVTVYSHTAASMAGKFDNGSKPARHDQGRSQTLSALSFSPYHSRLCHAGMPQRADRSYKVL
jgi:hypothetical protein